MNEQDNQPSRPLLATLDIDGTLARPATMRIDRPVRDAIARFVTAGHHVVLASGRSLVGVLPIARALGLSDGWVVASNGAVTAHLDSRSRRGYELDDVQNFDPGQVVRSSRALLPGLQIAAERVGWGYDVTHLFRPDELNGAQQIVSAHHLAGRSTTRLVLRGPGAGRLTESVRAAGLSAVLADEDWLDVTGPGLSKATALEKVRANLGVEPSRTVAIGDGLNDLEMFRWAARAVAMGHAPAEVRAAADVVTGTLDEHGAAVTLDALHTGAEPAFS